MLVRTGSGKPPPPTRLRQSASQLRVRASVIGPKAVPVRAAADKTSGKVGSVKAGEEVTILELQRTPSGTTRVRTQCGWTTAQTKQGRRLLEVDGDLEELLMRDLFRKVDADQDGRLDAAQLERFVASVAPGQPVDPASHAAMMEEIGAPDGLVTLAMYVDWLGQRTAGGVEPEPEPEQSVENAAQKLMDEALRSVREAQRVTSAAVDRAKADQARLHSSSAKLNKDFEQFKELGDRLFAKAAEAMGGAAMAGGAAGGGAGGGARRKPRRTKGWQPPQDDAARLRALGDGDKKMPPPPPWMGKCLLECCQPLHRPQPEDWLARGQPGDLNGDRTGQTFARFCRPGPHRNFPSKHKSSLLLVPIGDTAGGPPPEALVACLRAHFQMPVELMKPLTAAEEKQLEFDEEGYGYGRQLETYSSHTVLFDRLKKLREGFACVGFTMHDLCNSQSGFGFVFGEAQLDKSVGVFSFARYGSPSTVPDFLRRCCMVLTHEVTHLFGVKHCVFAHCLMNGSNHLEEAVARPFVVCPVCLRKVHDSMRAVGMELAARERAVGAFFREHGMEEDAVMSDERLLVMGDCA